jgi:DNA-binding IscR family transcriptional regulator
LLAKPASAITMGEVVRHFDGILAPIACVSTSHFEPCSQEGKCRFRRIMLDVRNYVSRMMDQATLASVFQQPAVTHEEVFSREFVMGDGI